MVFKPLLTKRDIRTIAAEFKASLRRAGIRISKLILFGSYATGKQHPWSDVDFCVVSPQFGRREYDDMVKLSKIAKKVNYLIEAHPMNPRDLKRGLHPLSEEIRRAGKAM